MVAAMFPTRDTVWYFRLTGPVAAVEDQENVFDRFLGSLKFKGDDVSWETPAGWKQEGATGFRYATLRSGPLELRVSKLRNEGQAAAALPNVNRWRGELGLPPWRDGELKENVKEVKADGVTGMRVAFSGTGGRGMGKGPALTDAKPPAPGGSAPFKFTLPEGWKDLGPKVSSGIRSVASFATPGGGELTVTPLPGDAGGLAENINRWRRQIGLGPADAGELAKLVEPIEIDGSKAQLVDLTGSSKRTLGAIVERPGTTWFYKLTGPADSLGKDKSAFESFLKSVRFDGASR